MAPRTTIAPDLTLTRVGVHLRALRAVTMPGLLAAPLRAALGPALRRVGCAMSEPCQGRCAQPGGCVFGLAFSALAARPGWGGTPPRPFWLQYDEVAPRPIRRGDKIGIAVVATPAMVPHLGTVLDAITLAAGRGLAGAPFAVDDHGPPETHNLESSSSVSLGWPDSLSVRFATPLRLKEHGRFSPAAPSLATLVKALTTRANALASLYGGATWHSDLRKVAERAGAALCVSDSTHWLGLLRPRRNGRPDSLSGLVGEVVYAPVDPEVKAWLAFGSVLHAGSDTVFGCGRIVAGPPASVALEPDSLKLVAELVAATVRRLGGQGRQVAITFDACDALVVQTDRASQQLADALRELSHQVGVAIRLSST